MQRVAGLVGGTRFGLRLLGVTALGLVGLVPGTRAQPPPRLERLEIALWPEYDRPATLVILRGFLPETTPLPVTVGFPIPASVAEPTAVAKRTADGNLVLAPYAIEDRGEWRVVQVETDRPEIRVEYYAALSTSGAQRHFVFDWPGGLEVDRVAYEVQEPRGAVGLAVTPGPQRRTMGGDGLAYHFADVGALGVGERLSIDVSYARTTEGLSTAARPSPFPAPAPGGVPAASQPAPGGTPLWLLLLAILLGGGAVYIWFAVSGKRS